MYLHVALVLEQGPPYSPGSEDLSQEVCVSLSAMSTAKMAILRDLKLQLV